MCTSPLVVKNKSPYQVFDVSPLRYQVPCGKCLECRSVKQDEWCTRLAYEINMFYRHGGIGVFLTLTYNDAELPIFAPLNQPCFNWEHVLQFLDRVNTYMQRVYGKYMYKYFLCSEYGKNTQRPHYHVLFLLKNMVDMVDFVEKCRDMWCEHGFMFPNYKDGHYVDNDGNIVTPALRDGAGSAKYVSKYITKDMSFYNLPSVAAWLDPKSSDFKIPFEKRKDMIKRCLPKHWQSKGIGLSQIEQVNLFDKSDVINALDRGVYEPLTGKVVPLSQYVINKMMYKSVRSERVSDTTGKKLYDRYLTDFGREYSKVVFKQRLKREVSKYNQFLQMHPYGRYSNLDLTKTALYKMVYRFMDKTSLVDSIMCNGVLDIVSDVDFAMDLWIKNKDTKFLKRHKPTFLRSAEFDEPLLYKRVENLFLDSCHFLALYEQVSFEERALIHLDKQRDKEKIDRIKRMFTSHYDVRLC